MKSIIQKSKTRCFICGRNGWSDPLDEHHVFFGSQKNAAERYGLKVYLCHYRCHEFGEDSVHKNAKVCRAVQAHVQRKAMKHYGWSVEEFIEKVGRNYIKEE